MPFCAIFYISFSLFAENLFKVFEQRNAEETTYGARDGPSCLWRSVGGSVVQLLKEYGEVCVTDRRSHDGPSCRFVIKIREVAQYLYSKSSSDLERRPSTDRYACDDPSYLPSRVMKRAPEEISSSMGRRISWRSVVTTTIRRYSVDQAAFWQLSSK